MSAVPYPSAPLPHAHASAAHAVTKNVARLLRIKRAPWFEEARANTLLTKLRGLKRADLYRRARGLDIPGRSAMNKDQLVMALAANERKQRMNSRVVSSAGGTPRPSAFEPNPGPPSKRMRRTSPSWVGRPLDIF